MLGDKYIGLILAILSNVANGVSFVVTKKGLMQTEAQYGCQGEGFLYLRSPIWWAGILTHVVGEFFNFAAYAFAPAILVTPLGALAVLVGAVLASFFLHEHLGTLGRMGSAVCLLGAVIIVLHAPPDKDVQTVDEILEAAVRSGFLFYVLLVIVFSAYMIYVIAPTHGKSNPLVYVSICSTVGSITVMSVKALGIALKLTFANNNQLSHVSTYVFLASTIICILTQMNYFNKALATFPSNIVNPLYYVTFTTATLCASFILFNGLNTTDVVTTLSLTTGFIVTFLGVTVLNLSRGGGPAGYEGLSARGSLDETATDLMHVSGRETRAGLQARASTELS